MTLHFLHPNPKLFGRRQDDTPAARAYRLQEWHPNGAKRWLQSMHLVIMIKRKIQRSIDQSSIYSVIVYCLQWLKPFALWVIFLSNWLVIEPIKYKGLYRRQKNYNWYDWKEPCDEKKCQILSNEQSLIIKKNWAWYLSGISVQLYNIISLSLFMRYCH